MSLSILVRCAFSSFYTNVTHAVSARRARNWSSLREEGGGEVEKEKFFALPMTETTGFDFGASERASVRKRVLIFSFSLFRCNSQSGRDHYL